MYEDKKNKVNINWKSLLIKMAILLVVVFIILWIVSLVNKDKNKSKDVKSNLDVNLQAMKETALEYFTESRLPVTVNGKKKITLQEMVDGKLIVEFKDQYNKTCDGTKSYAEATKINVTDYAIKVKLVCSTEEDYIINNIKIEKPDNTDNNGDNNSNNNTNNTDNNSSNNSTNTNTNNTTNKPNTNTTVTKPNTNNTTSKPNTSTTVTKPVVTCPYGNREMAAVTSVAYLIPGNCAVSKSDYYRAAYFNPATSVGNREYQILNTEMGVLRKNTGRDIYIENPVYTPVYNKANTGLLGYKIMFSLRERPSGRVVYRYYLNQDGTRNVETDIRSSLTPINNDNNKPTTIRVKSISLNKSRLDLYVGDKSILVATISPSNATNKTLTWKSDNNSIAEVNNGVVTAKGVGTTTIRVYADGIEKSINVYVTLKEVNVSNINISVSALDLYIGDISTIGAKLVPSNATSDITWSIGNSSIASISYKNDGRVTIRAKKAGTTTLTATAGGVSKSIKVTIYSTEKYRYCKTEKERVYSTTYIDASTVRNNNKYSYQVTLKTNNINVYDVEYSNLQTGNDYYNAYNYLVNKNKPLSLVGGTSTGGIDPKSYMNLNNHSLKSYNFTPNVKYVGRNGNTLYFNITNQIKNGYNVKYATPFYTSYNSSVYFVPLYFDVITIDNYSCEYVGGREVSAYIDEGYIRVN